MNESESERARESERGGGISATIVSGKKLPGFFLETNFQFCFIFDPNGMRTKKLQPWQDGRVQYGRVTKFGRSGVRFPFRRGKI